MLRATGVNKSQFWWQGLKWSNSGVSACLVGFLMLTSVMPVLAQTSQTTITNLQYPSQVAMQNGVAQVTITFTVSFSGLPSGGYLVFGILYPGTPNYVAGSANSKPDSCIALTGKAANSAECVTLPRSWTGTESASFTLTFNSAQQYSLRAGAGMTSSSAVLVSGSISAQDFTISVTG